MRTFLLPFPGQKHLRTLSGGSQSYPKPSTGPRGIGVALVTALILAAGRDWENQQERDADSEGLF